MTQKICIQYLRYGCQMLRPPSELILVSKYLMKN